MAIRQRRASLITVLFFVFLMAPIMSQTHAASIGTPPSADESLEQNDEPYPTGTLDTSAVTPTETTESIQDDADRDTVEPTLESETIHPAIDVPASEGSRAEGRMISSSADPTLIFEATTSDSMSAEGVEVVIQSSEQGRINTLFLDASGAASTSLPFGAYTAVISDPNGIYDNVIRTFTFTTDGQVVPLLLETYASHGSARFVATTSDGRSAEGITIQVSSEEFVHTYPAREFDAENSATVVRLPYGMYRYTIPPTGTYEGVTNIFVIDEPTETVRVTLTALPGGSITLIATTGDGQSAEGASVELLDADGNPIHSGQLDVANTIVFRNVVFGEYRFTVDPVTAHDNYSSDIFTFDEDRIITFDLMASGSGSLTVTVREEGSETPIPGASVSIQRAGTESPVVTGTTDEAGRLTTAILPAGSYAVTVSHPDYIQSPANEVQLDGNTTRVIDLAPAPTETETPIVTVTPIPSETAAPLPSETATVTPSPSETETVTPEPSVTSTVAVTPEPSQTATVTPQPNVTPAETVTPEPSQTAAVTPEPSETATATTTVTPVETVTPESSVTPVETVTPIPSETPTQPVTPEPSETATVAPEPSETPSATATVTPAPTQVIEETQMQTSFRLCANDDCTPPYNTGADGFTVSWTVTEDTEARIDASRLASAGASGQPISLSALQQDPEGSYTITATIEDGVATGLSRPIPVGFYRVCLNPLLVGPDGSTIVLADVPACDAVQLTTDGPVPNETGEETESVPFSIVIVGAPEIVPPADPENPPLSTDELVQQLVELLIEILEEILAESVGS
jgi:hypothetical protein